MTSIQQREQLQSQIWKIANEVRGAVDGWDFKQFVLGTLFYRFISENFTDYIEGGDDSIDYASLPDSVITPEIKDDAVKTKGYFIYPSQLFGNVVKTANTNPNLNTDLKAIFDSIESSANGYASEKNIKGLFDDFDTSSTRFGNTVENKISRLAAVLKGVVGLNFGNFEEHEISHKQLRSQCRKVRRRIFHAAKCFKTHITACYAQTGYCQQDIRPGRRFRFIALASQETI